MIDREKLALEALEEARDRMTVLAERDWRDIDEVRKQVDQAIAALNEEPQKVEPTGFLFKYRDEGGYTCFVSKRDLPSFEKSDSWTKIGPVYLAPQPSTEIESLTYERFSKIYDTWAENHSPSKDGWEGSRKALFDALQGARDAELAPKRTLDLRDVAAPLGDWTEDIECDNSEVLVKLSAIRDQLPDIEVIAD